jgi:uncharacterized membrane protein
MKNMQCAITGKVYHEDSLIPLLSLDSKMKEFVRSKYPDLNEDSLVGEDQVISLKRDYLNKILTDEIGDLDVLESTVVNSISENKLLSGKVEDFIEKRSTFGERIADRIAAFGGSWTFIISFFSFIIFWIVMNLLWLNNKAFDPYPFILLNLMLSCLAAIQAPIIMMSQNRQESKDRIRSEHDYKINLKAELEIQLLHKKVDHLLIHQTKRLMEIQRIQSEMTDAMFKKISQNKD